MSTRSPARSHLFVALTLVAAFFVPQGVFAYQSAALGETITLGEFVYEDDYTPSTADCTISIYDPAGSVIVNADVMSEHANGWHYYDYSIGGGAAAGTWPAFMSCGDVLTGDLVKVDKTFTVTATSLYTDVSAIKTVTDTIDWSEIASLQGDVTSLVTEIGTGNIAAIKTSTDTINWSDITAIVTDTGAIRAVTDTINWSDVTAIMTATDTINWTDVTAIMTKTDTIDWTDVTDIKANVATLISEVGTGNINAIKTKTDTIEWADITGIVTAAGDIQAKTDTIAWTDVTAIMTKTDTIDWTDVTGIKTQTDTIVWGDIDAIKAITDTIDWTDVTDIKANVATLISEVGTGNIAAIKTKTDTIEWADITAIITDTGDIKLKTDTIAWADIGAIITQTDTINWSDVTGIKTSTDTIDWTDVTAIRAVTDTINWSDIASIPANVWANATRTLTSFGTLVADVWSDGTAPTRRLTDSTLTGGGSLATSSELASDTADILAGIADNADLINGLNDISATDVWAAGTRTLTDTGATATADAVWNKATSALTTSGTIGKRIADNLDAQVSTRGTSSITAADVWAAGTRTLTDYSSSAIATAAATAVWANATRTLTNYGNDITAAQVWDVLTSSLTTIDSVGKLIADNIDTPISSVSGGGGPTVNSWTTIMSDQSSVQAGDTYRARVEIRNADSEPTAPFAAPRVTLYDPERNVVVSSVAMTSIGTGIYEYTYATATSASQGVWEAIVSTEVESGKTLTNNDYWLVAGSPAQVIINSVTGSTPTAIANLTITNEGLAGYEYDYEWCVVSSLANACGGGDDIYHGTGAKFINPGEDWNTNLSATVSTAGSYYFKVVVYFGTESSGSSRSFTISNPVVTSGGGGGGGGGGFFPPPAPFPTSTACKGADFNHDAKVNSVDFSILLSFWKTNPPFKNPCADINIDSKVNSVDFSILLAQWGTSGKEFVKP